MIRYTVIWHETAQDQLAQIWLDATDRTAITSAANEIDVQLASDAESKGLEVEGGLRELAEPPLEVHFLVSEPDRMVRVLQVARLS